MTPTRDISRLLEIMAALRTPVTGCPWDLEQNFATIAPYTVEEAYEVVDALRYRPHPSHFSVSEALEWITRVQPRRAILTNMHIDLDFEELRSRLPPDVEPAYDGLKIEFAGAGGL